MSTDVASAITEMLRQGTEMVAAANYLPPDAAWYTVSGGPRRTAFDFEGQRISVGSSGRVPLTPRQAEYLTRLGCRVTECPSDATIERKRQFEELVRRKNEEHAQAMAANANVAGKAATPVDPEIEFAESASVEEYIPWSQTSSVHGEVPLPPAPDSTDEEIERGELALNLHRAFVPLYKIAAQLNVDEATIRRDIPMAVDRAERREREEIGPTIAPLPLPPVQASKDRSTAEVEMPKTSARHRRRPRTAEQLARQAEVFRMFRVEGMSFRAIGALIHVSASVAHNDFLVERERLAEAESA